MTFGRNVLFFFIFLETSISKYIGWFEKFLSFYKEMMDAQYFSVLYYRIELRMIHLALSK